MEGKEEKKEKKEKERKRGQSINARRIEIVAAAGAQRSFLVSTSHA